MPVHPDAFARIGIRDAQRRYWPDGHVRIGTRVATRDGGERPAKLSTFRVTSPSRLICDSVAELYGGTVEPFQRGNDKWQVTTGVDELTVLIPPDPVSSWLEVWNAGGICERRCDGQGLEHKTGRSCLCMAEGVQRCELVTRLFLMLADVPSLGMWLLTTKSKIAFKELPRRAEFANRAGDYVSAILALHQGHGLTPEGKPTTYGLPVLRIEGGLTPHQVMSGAPARAVQASPAVGELDTGATTRPQQIPDYLARARAVRTPRHIDELLAEAHAAGHLTDALRETLTKIRNTLADRVPARSAPAPSAETLRAQILTDWNAGTSDLHKAFHQHAGTTLAKASVRQLQSFIARLAQTSRPQPAAGSSGDGAEEIVLGQIVDVPFPT